MPCPLAAARSARPPRMQGALRRSLSLDPRRPDLPPRRGRSGRAAFLPHTHSLRQVSSRNLKFSEKDSKIKQKRHL